MSHGSALLTRCGNVVVVARIRRPRRKLRRPFGGALCAISVVMVIACGAGRGRVAIVEAAVRTDNQSQAPTAYVVLVVPTCDGNPEVTQIEEDADEVRVAIISGPSSHATCQDAVRVDLELGDRVLVDLTTGNPVEVTRVQES